MGASRGLRIKADTFLYLHNLQKTTQNASKCTNIVHFWQRLEAQGFRLENDTKFGLRGMPGGSYESIKGCIWEMLKRSSTFSMEGTVAEGGKLRRPDSAADLRNWECHSWMGVKLKFQNQMIMKLWGIQNNFSAFTIYVNANLHHKHTRTRDGGCHWQGTNPVPATKSPCSDTCS